MQKDTCVLDELFLTLHFPLTKLQAKKRLRLAAACASSAAPLFLPSTPVQVLFVDLNLKCSLRPCHLLLKAHSYTQKTLVKVGLFSFFPFLGYPCLNGKWKYSFSINAGVYASVSPFCGFCVSHLL